MELKLDDMQMDTGLAKNYLKSIKEFHSFGPSNYKIKASTQCWDYQDYKIFHLGELYDGTFNDMLKSSYSPYDCKLSLMKALAAKIREQSNLIVQLEYLLRHKPEEDTRLQLDLITKQLSCAINTTRCSTVTMFPDSPLLNLGCVASLKALSPKIIVATKETAVICFLFTKLCHLVGLDGFHLIIGTHESLQGQTLLNFSKSKELSSGSLGVVTDHSDVDSAVDVFLACSLQSPWRLRRILVQESVYQTFKDALSWKCSLKAANANEISLTYQKFCPDIFRYNDRVFLFDYIGLKSTPQLLSEVAVEAYRTTKELLSLIKKYEPFFLSLWANDVAEANEIAHAVKCRVVWVNNFADFRGPARISNIIYDAVKFQNYMKNESFYKLIESSEIWLKLEIADRKEILCHLIESNMSRLMHITNKSLEFFTKILNELESDANGFVEVGKNYVCMGIAQPVEIVEVSCTNGSLFDLRTLQALVLGNALAVTEQDPFLDLFKESGIPVAFIDLEQGDFRIAYGSDNVTKVIWNNLGTIFAN